MASMRRGIKRIEVIVILAVIAVVFSFAYVSLSRLRAKSNINRSGSQVRGIHQSWLIFARDFNGEFPMPGMMKRLPVMRNDIEVIVPGQGEPDISQNTTANLYSVCIMQNYISPELCVSSTEPSGKVFVCDTYNWDLYDPTVGAYWDPAFVADLQTGSNVSYAHMPLFGERRVAQWRESHDEKYPVVGDRGPRDGNDPNSITHEIHKPYNKWNGHIIFNDNSVNQLTDSMFIGEVEVDGQMVPDNIYKMELGPGGLDAFLGFTKAMTEDGPVLSWD